MSVRSRRLAIAGVITVTAIAVPTAALASGPQTPSSSPPKPSASAAAAKTSPGPAGLASSAGISRSQLNAGLVAAKRVGGSGPAGIAAFAASTGVTGSTAQRIVHAVFGASADNASAGNSMAAALAAQLGTSTTAARHAMKQIERLSGSHGVDPASSAFAAVAHGLGVSPARLAGALTAAKRSLAGG